MKMRLTIGSLLILGLTFGAYAQEEMEAERKNKKNPQNLRSWTVGVRGLYLYDLPSRVYDTELSEDPVGLNGDNTNLDFGLEALVEYQFTPFFGMQAFFRYGGLTGANDLEYYENTFLEGRLGAILIWSNLDPNHAGSKWNFYNNLGMMYGSFEADRFLEADDAPNGSIDDEHLGMYLGAGFQHELARSWRIDFEVNYNMVRTDGFDGFDYATAWDPYLSVGLGVAYTFGNSEKPAMYATNYFEAPYYDLARTKAKVAELEDQMRELARQRASDKEKIYSTIEKVKEENNRQDDNIGNLSARMDSLETNPPGSREGYRAMVFFAFDSDYLTAQARQRLLEGLKGRKGPFTVIAYADQIGTDAYNRDLKQRRAESVKEFMVERMGFSADEISIEIGNIEGAEKDNLLLRRVEVK